MAAFDVVGIGLACVDLLALAPRLPGRDEVFRLAGTDMQGGGPVATALVALARLGASTSYLGRLAPDAFGSFIRSDFERYGVSTEHIRTAEDGATSALSMILVEQPTGARSILYHLGTVPEFGLDAAQEAAVRGARLLHFDGLHLPAAFRPRLSPRGGCAGVIRRGGRRGVARAATLIGARRYYGGGPRLRP